MKITKTQLRHIIREAIYDTLGDDWVSPYDEGRSDAISGVSKRGPEEFDEDDYEEYEDGYESGLDDARFWGGVVKKVTGGK